MLITPTDNQAYRFPVSMKGIFFIEGKIPLLKNERDEYELPGGKLELEETPENCLIREIEEEMGIQVTTKTILDSWLYHINQDTHVVIITYACTTKASINDLILSHEHKELNLFMPNEISGLNMPEGYKRSIDRFIIL